ncbi:hypothetical protein GP486_000677 [Trichoglossum hirsutum]|uniref:Uncharacterized protein n=1 Tax=Trichoglossum hirsutum TaxID=265104 RepID=A0A9P8LIL0_9PEZI|nr:hypothetical protein GP486_000677 [Trichoglossum hirsutum]
MVINTALQVICAYPVSSQYGRMVRYLIYPLLTLSLLFSVAGWVAGGALNTAMTYIAITGIHLAAMAVNREAGVLDLDVLTAYHVCMVALILSPPLIMWTKSLRRPSGKGVFAIWVVLLWIGVILFTVSAKHLPKSVPCLDSKRENVTSTGDLQSCMLACSNFSLPLRQFQDTRVVVAPKYYDQMSTITLSGTIIVSFFVLFALIHAGIAPSLAPDGTQRSQMRGQLSSFEAGFAAKSASLIFSLPLKLSVAATITWIFIMEFTILRHLPQAETNTAISQWGPLAAFALVTLAGGVSRLTTPSPGISQAIPFSRRTSAHTEELERQYSSGTTPWNRPTETTGILPPKDGFWARILSVG